MEYRNNDNNDYLIAEERLAMAVAEESRHLWRIVYASVIGAFGCGHADALRCADRAVDSYHKKFEVHRLP